MPGKAKAYIALVIASGTLVLLFAAGSWSTANLRQFAVYLGLATLASTLKVRIPGLESTASLNFVMLLLGIVALPFSQVVAISVTAALAQSLWKTQRRPKPVQVLFNAACLTVCTAMAFWAAHSVPEMLGLHSVAAMMVLGACVYVVLNTGLVSLVVALAEQSSLKQVWPSCYEWTFPYFLVGSAISGLASAGEHGTNLGMTLLVVPVLYFLHVYYRMHIVRAVLESLSSVKPENEAVLSGAIQGR